MENSKQTTEELIDRYLSGTANANERDQLERLYANASLRRESIDDLGIDEVNQLKKEGLVAALAEIRKEKGKTMVLWPRIAVVAAAVAAVVFGIWFFSSKYQDASIKTGSIASVNDIAPGKNGATITLASGEVIELSGKKKGVVIGDKGMKYSDGSTDPSLPMNRDRFSSGGERSGVLTAQTAKGQTYEFILPDGTHVWLNADSKISFPNQFTGKERKILLSGEAYFAVVHNDKQPFRVESKGQVVEDIGTEFNINAYADESSIKTTLVEGSARVASLSPLEGPIPTGRESGVILKPNQQAVLLNNKLDVITANIDQIMAWKNGKFAFQKESLQNIMTGVARWYNVEVVFEPGFESKPFTGSMSRFENISTVLHVLELTGTVHFKVEGRRVTVMR
ncbi:MAG: FecR domain-containing protein [Bacteroidota bacterium]